MKKSAFFLLLFALASNTFSQCIADTSILSVGFYPPDSLLPCVEDSIFYDEVLQFKNFSQVSGSIIGQPGLIITIISVQIDSVKNLPAGISYVCNTANCFYTTGESGCVRLSGTTTAPPGIYNLGFYATLIVDLGFGPFQFPADSQFLATNGLGYSLTVLNPGGICPNKHSGQIYFNASVITPSICEGDTVPLHTLTSGGMAPYSYVWRPGVNLSDSTTTDPFLYPNNPGTYTVTVTDDIGFSAIDSVVISYAQGPVISLSSDTTVCPGDSVQLGASGGTAYSWFPAAGLSATNISNPIASPSQSTIYTVTVSNGSCTGTDNVTVAIDTVHPHAAFDSIVNNFTVLFVNTSSGASSYYWDFGDGSNPSTVKNPQHQYAQHSSYLVTLIAGNSCGFSDTVTNVVDLAVGISSLTDQNLINVYPNPGTGFFELRMEEFQGGMLSYEVISVCGSTVKKESLRINNSVVIQLDLSDQSKGIYFLKVSSDSHSSIRKIVLR